MTDEVPMISYWMGVPLNKVPRDELEREFCRAWQEINRLNHKISEMSIAHVQDLATFKRRELQEKHPFLNWLNKYV